MIARGRQTIFCTVVSYKNHSRIENCLLDCIQVSPPDQHSRFIGREHVR